MLSGHVQLDCIRAFLFETAGVWTQGNYREMAASQAHGQLTQETGLLEGWLPAPEPCLKLMRTQ